MPMWPWDGLMWIVACFPFFGNSILFPQHRQWLLGNFFIFGLSSGIEIWRRGISYCKGLKKPSLIPRRIVTNRCWQQRGLLPCVSMSSRFDCSYVLYKVLFNKSFDGSLYYITSFVKSYCVSYFKKLWNCSACFLWKWVNNLVPIKGFCKPHLCFIIASVVSTLKY
jgi:hypothetical protein